MVAGNHPGDQAPGARGHPVHVLVPGRVTTALVVRLKLAEPGIEPVGSPVTVPAVTPPVSGGQHLVEPPDRHLERRRLSVPGAERRWAARSASPLLACCTARPTSIGGAQRRGAAGPRPRGPASRSRCRCRPGRPCGRRAGRARWRTAAVAWRARRAARRRRRSARRSAGTPPPRRMASRTAACARPAGWCRGRTNVRAHRIVGRQAAQRQVQLPYGHGVLGVGAVRRPRHVALECGRAEPRVDLGLRLGRVPAHRVPFGAHPGQHCSRWRCNSLARWNSPLSDKSDKAILARTSTVTLPSLSLPGLHLESLGSEGNLG